MSETGILLQVPDKQTLLSANRAGLPVAIGELVPVPFERTLIVAPAIEIPWDLLAAGFRFLERWDAAAPLWRYGVLAKDIGAPAERVRTEALTLDLRVPVYACELLFVRDSPEARRLLEVWQAERQYGPDSRLAFLRALYRVKPLFCALPRGWLREAAQAVKPAPRRPSRSAGGLVHVEIAPGRYVCCRPEEVERYRAQFERMKYKRRT